MGTRNYLVEGVSATGKTSVCDELARRGFHAVRGDREFAYPGDPVTGEPLRWGMRTGSPHQQHLWDVDRVRALMDDVSHPETFLCAGSRNVARFVHRFDLVFVLVVDRTTLDQRPARRPPGEFGARPEERGSRAMASRQPRGRPRRRAHRRDGPAPGSRRCDHCESTDQVRSPS